MSVNGRPFASGASGKTFPWNGKVNGFLLPDGKYTLRLNAGAVEKTVDVVIDTQRPTISSAEVMDFSGSEDEDDFDFTSPRIDYKFELRAEDRAQGVNSGIDEQSARLVDSTPSFIELKPSVRITDGTYGLTAVYGVTTEDGGKLSYRVVISDNAGNISKPFHGVLNVKVDVEITCGMADPENSQAALNPEPVNAFRVLDLALPSPQVPDDAADEPIEGEISGFNLLRVSPGTLAPTVREDNFYVKAQVPYKFKGRVGGTSNDPKDTGKRSSVILYVNKYDPRVSPSPSKAVYGEKLRFFINKGSVQYKKRWNGKISNNKLRMFAQTAPEGTYICYTTTPSGATVKRDKTTLFKISHKECITQVEWLKTRPAVVSIDRTAHIFDGHIFALNPQVAVSGGGRRRTVKDIFGHYNPMEADNLIDYEVPRPSMPDGSPYDEHKDKLLGFPVIQGQIDPRRSPHAYRTYTDIMRMANRVYNGPLKEQAKNNVGNPIQNAWNAPVVLPNGRVIFVAVVEKLVGRQPNQIRIPYHTVYPGWVSQQWYEDHIPEHSVF